MPISYSRAQLEQMLKSGQSVIINGRHIESLEDLPSEADLALGDRSRTQAALEAHDQQIAGLIAERKKLQAQLDATPDPPAPPAGQPSRPVPSSDAPKPAESPGRPAGPQPPEPQPAEAQPAAAPEPGKPPAEAPKPPEPARPLFTPPPPRAPAPDEGEGDDRGRARGRRGA